MDVSSPTLHYHKKGPCEGDNTIRITVLPLRPRAASISIQLLSFRSSEYRTTRHESEEKSLVITRHSNIMLQVTNWFVVWLLILGRVSVAKELSNIQRKCRCGKFSASGKVLESTGEDRYCVEICRKLPNDVGEERGLDKSVKAASDEGLMFHLIRPIVFRKRSKNDSTPCCIM